VLKLEQLTKVYKTGDKALTNINLSVEAGQVVGLIGPSGAGKSSLLRCINRLVERLAVMENVLSGRLGYVPFWRRRSLLESSA